MIVFALQITYNKWRGRDFHERSECCMLINVNVRTMKDAERLSQICKDYEAELLLRGKDKKGRTGR